MVGTSVGISSIYRTLEMLYYQARVPAMDKHIVMTRINFILEHIVPNEWSIVADLEFMNCPNYAIYQRISSKCRSHFDLAEYPRECKIYEVLDMYDKFLKYYGSMKEKK